MMDDDNDSDLQPPPLNGHSRQFEAKKVAFAPKAPAGKRNKPESSEERIVDQETVKKKKEDEKVRVMDMMARYQENHAKKDQALSKVPPSKDGIYGVKIKPSLPEASDGKIRKTLGLEHLFEADNDPTDVNHPRAGSLKNPPPTAEQLLKEEQERRQIAEKMTSIGGVKVFSPHVKLQPLNKFLEEHLSPRAHEARAAAASAKTTAAPKPKPVEAMQVGGNRVNTLVRGKKPAAAKAVAASVDDKSTEVTKDISDGDPAKSTIERWNVEQVTLLQWYEQKYQWHLRKCAFDAKKHAYPLPYEMSSEHVAWLMTEPHEPFSACMFGHMCLTYRISARHRGGAFFGKRMGTPAQREEFERSNKAPQQIAPYCYSCHRGLIDFMLDDNVGSVRRSDKVFVEYYHIKDRPGEYLASAMRKSVDGYTDGNTRPLRRFDTDEFEPCYKEVLVNTSGADGKTHLVLRRLKALKEPDYVFCINTTAPVPGKAKTLDPSSYQVTKISGGIPTAESILRRNFINPVTAVKRPDQPHELELRPISEDKHVPPAKVKVEPLTPEQTEEQIKMLTSRRKEIVANSSMASSDKIRAIGQIREQIIDLLRGSQLTSMAEEGEEEEGPKPKKVPSPPLPLPFSYYIDEERLRLSLESVKQETALDNRMYDLAFRDFEEAYLLLKHWYQDHDVSFAESYGLLPAVDASDWPNKETGILSPPNIPPLSKNTLILYLLLMRVKIVANLERKLASGDYDKEGRKLPQGPSLTGRSISLRRQKTIIPNQTIIQKLVYWKKRHNYLLAWFRMRHEKAESMEDEPLLQPREEGSSIPLYEELFREKGEKVPLTDADFIAVRYKVLHYRKPTPSQLLFLDYQRDVSSGRDMPSTVQDKLGIISQTVLCDFRKTVEYLSSPDNQNLEIPTNYWMPEFHKQMFEGNQLLSYYLETSTYARNELLNKQIERAKKKAVNASGANTLSNEEVVANVVASAEATAPVSSLKDKLNKEKQNLATQTEKLMENTKAFNLRLGVNKNKRIREVLTKGKWWGPRFGESGSHFILAALVYRVNMATEMMEYERASLEGLEDTLKALQEKLKEAQRDHKKAPGTKDETSQEADNNEDEEEEDDDGRKAFEVRFEKLLKTWNAEERANPKTDVEIQLCAKIEEQLERVHLWKRVVYSHLELASVITDPSLDNESDTLLLNGRLRGNGASLYQLSYPYDHISFTEESLERISDKVSSIDLISASGTERNSSDWHNILKKLFHNACSEREFGVRLDDLCKRNSSLYRYVVECWRASLGSMYRHCRIVTKFDLAVELHRVCKLAVTLPEGQRMMMDTFMSNEEIVLHAMQESVSRQYCHDNNIRALNSQWVHGCMELVRALFNQRRNIEGINSYLLTAYGKQEFGKLQVLRVTHNNFIKFICNTFRNLEIARILGTIINSNTGKTSVYRLSKCVVEAMLHYVEAIRPGKKISVQWFTDLGVSSEGVKIILDVYEKFIHREAPVEINNLLKKLNRLDYEIMALFFYMLRRHYSARLIPLDGTFAMAQEQAIRKRYMIKDGEPIPSHLLHGFNCSVMGCNELKSFIVQEVGTTSWYGNSRTLWDETRQKLFCASKKTILGKERNSELIDEFKDTEPEWIVNARKKNYQDFFYATVEDFDDILSKASQTQSYRTEQQKCKDRLRDFIDYANTIGICPIREEAIAVVLDGPTQELLDSLNPAEADLLCNTIKEIQSGGKKLSKRVWKLKYRWPCYLLPVNQVELCGFVYEKDKIKEKEISRGITICPSCGSISRFGTDMYQTNGFFCICNKNEPAMIALPRCMFCNQHRKTLSKNGDIRDQKYANFRKIEVMDDGPDGTRTKTLVHVCGGCYRYWFKWAPKMMSKTELIYCLNHGEYTQNVRPYLMPKPVTQIIKPDSPLVIVLASTVQPSALQQEQEDRPQHGVSIKSFYKMRENGAFDKRRKF